MDTIASIGGLEGQGLGVVTELSVVAVDGRGSSELLELRPGVTLWGYATRSALRERGVILHTCNNGKPGGTRGADSRDLIPARLSGDLLYNPDLGAREPERVFGPSDAGGGPGE